MSRLRAALAASCVTVLVGLAALGGAVLPRLAGAQAAAIQTQETNFPGVNAELVECRRKDGVLTIRLRLRNTGDKPQRVTLINGRDYEKYYVTAGTKKYFVLRDTEKTPLAVASDSSGILAPTIPQGGAYNFWAKYPAPPADVKKVNYITPLGVPFEDVPVTD
jgi:hypothetical protein